MWRFTDQAGRETGAFFQSEVKKILLFQAPVPQWGEWVNCPLLFLPEPRRTRLT
jgi:hypothetical protein